MCNFRCSLGSPSDRASLRKAATDGRPLSKARDSGLGGTFLTQPRSVRRSAAAPLFHWEIVV
jgi:hypothetical protein